MTQDSISNSTTLQIAVVILASLVFISVAGSPSAAQEGDHHTLPHARASKERSTKEPPIANGSSLVFGSQLGDSISLLQLGIVESNMRSSTGDLDSDGDSDLVLSVSRGINPDGDPGRWVLIFFNDGCGQFQLFDAFRISDFIGAASGGPPIPAEISLADIDADSDLDLVLTSGNQNNPQVIVRPNVYPQATTIPADVNNDGLVNGIDLAKVLASWTG